MARNQRCDNVKGLFVQGAAKRGSGTVVVGSMKYWWGGAARRSGGAAEVIDVIFGGRGSEAGEQTPRW